jgi:penicillin-binding protein 2
MSCNVYFFHLGNILGIEAIHRYGEMFGFGSPTGIDLEGEDTGTLPSDEWKRKNHYDRWWPGDTLSVAIGQGYLTATPIQLAQMASIIANGGIVYRPHVVRQVYDAQSQTWTVKEPEILRRLPIAPEVFAAVRDAALSVVADPSGTGKRAQVPGVLVAGKTGTAQVTALGSEHLARELNDHALFVSFAPADNPMIALAIVVENGGKGGAAAAPIAHDILEVFLRKRGLVPTKEELQLRMAAREAAQPEKRPQKKANNA